MGSVISLYRGDDKRIILTVKDVDGDAFPCTGCTLTLRVKKNIDDEDGDEIISITGVITAVTNVVTFTITAAMTSCAKAVANLKDDKPYPYDIQLVTGAGLKYTALRSQFVILTA